MSTATLDNLQTILERRLTPRVACAPRGVQWCPHPPHPKQRAFLMLTEQNEVFYGGSGGGAKTSALLMAALQFTCVPGYTALVMRKTHDQLIGGDGLIPRSQEWLAATPAEWIASSSRHTNTWLFPSGATLKFGYAEYERDRYRFQGDAYQYVAFDELTTWPSDKVYVYVGFSRRRAIDNPCMVCGLQLRAIPGRVGEFEHLPPEAASEFVDARAATTTRPHRPVTTLPFCDGCGLTVADVPLRTRAAANPGGQGGIWVKSRFNLPHGRRDRPFVRSLLRDNPSLRAGDYAAGLMELDAVEREQILRGDWDIKEAGRMFDRRHFLGTADAQE